jgi:hypothetical protein
MIGPQPTPLTASNPGHADPERASLSPALGRLDAVGLNQARELKFLLTERAAAEIEARLLPALSPDPHGDPALGGMYEVTSLAFDAPEFPVFFRDRCVRNRKYRVRRYGGSATLFLERKRSRAGVVRKRRIDADPGDLASLSAWRAPRAAHAWFVRDLRALDLAPVGRVRYLRRALYAPGAAQPVRVTFDRGVRGSLASGWVLDAEGEERPLFEGAVICEFKFLGVLPALLRSVIADLRLAPTGVSKYRACVRAFAGELGLDLPAPRIRVPLGVPGA